VLFPPQSHWQQPGQQNFTSWKKSSHDEIRAHITLHRIKLSATCLVGVQRFLNRNWSFCYRPPHGGKPADTHTKPDPTLPAACWTVHIFVRHKIPQQQCEIILQYKLFLKWFFNRCLNCYNNLPTHVVNANYVFNFKKLLNQTDLSTYLHRNYF